MTNKFQTEIHTFIILGKKWNHLNNCIEMIGNIRIQVLTKQTKQKKKKRGKNFSAISKDPRPKTKNKHLNRIFGPGGDSL